MNIALTRSRGRIPLRMTCLRLGQDLCVTLSGGDREHIGAIALGQPGNNPPATIALEGHREEALAAEIAQRVSNSTRATVCVACGIHVEHLLPEELKAILELSRELTDELLEKLKP